jgi:N-methylhydantoinase A
MKQHHFPVHQKPDIALGVDTGGTFTDFVLLRDGRLEYCKVLSTPRDPSKAIIEGLLRLGVEGESLTIIHGTTVGTNAVLEDKGARVVYVTSDGFADVLTLGRQQRSQVYALRQAEQAPPVPRDLCLTVSSRIIGSGKLCTPATSEALVALRSRLDDLAPEAVALNLLFSFLCPEEEQRIASALGGNRFISCSSDVLPEPKEYERGIATWLNASVGPVIGRYLSRLRSQVPAARISVMQSAGTTIAANQAAAQAVRLLLSGPAGGLAAAVAIGRAAGQERLLTFDMGGTSTDVALLDGEIPLTGNGQIGEYPLAITSVDMHTIGAGGGSIAHLDSGGMLMVGPESAGADPGPACYGQGGIEATVTDANLVLGRIPKATLLGGYMGLHIKAAENAVGRLAVSMKCTCLEAARGIVRVANEHMARALRVMSVERGHDPRDYSLFSFGGAGGLHACELAQLLGMRSVILPARSGVLSALGMLLAQPGRHLSRAMLCPIKSLSDTGIKEIFSELEAGATAQLVNEGLDAGNLILRYRMELRYVGQSATIRVEFKSGSDHAEAFHRAHEMASGHRLDQDVELVALRLGVVGPAVMDSVDKSAMQAASSAGRQCVNGRTPVWERALMQSGEELHGPACIVETGATAWIEEGWCATMDELGNLWLTQQHRRPESQVISS